MVLVAIVGGTSPTLGRSLVAGILASGKHDVVILSRIPSRPTASLEPIKCGARVAYVDYSSLDSIKSALAGVHTIISVLKIIDPAQALEYHANLLRAAIAACVQRFAASDWSMGPKSHSSVDVLAHKAELYQVCRSIADESESGIDVCQFQNGMFMEYFAQNLPNVKDQSRQHLLAGLQDDLMLDYIDVSRGLLLVPLRSDGRPAEVSMTSIADVGRFIAAALDLPAGSWRGNIGLVGTTTTLAHVAEILSSKTCAPSIKHETITAEQCDQKIKEYDNELARGFDLNALKGKMVAQMFKISCLGELGGSVVEPRLNMLLAKGGNPVEGRDLVVYLEDVWGSKS